MDEIDILKLVFDNDREIFPRLFKTIYAHNSTDELARYADELYEDGYLGLVSEGAVNKDYILTTLNEHISFGVYNEICKLLCAMGNQTYDMCQADILNLSSNSNDMEIIKKLTEFASKLPR